MNTPDFNENAPLYVIGDIHGRLDLLEPLIDAIHRDAGSRGAGSLTVTVGDYIDRGPNSRAVIDRLMANPFPGHYVALKGNHEAAMMDFLDDPEFGEAWWRNGAAATLRSFGVPVAESFGPSDFVQAQQALRAALTPKEILFLTSLRTALSVGRYFICHAGVRPGIPLERQREQDLLWIRGAFLDSDMNFGKIIVHGHTPVREPEVKANRINVDTGAIVYGRLTCVVLENGGHRFLTASS
ncbi:MAG: metallophosphoesterase family protein [Pseudolabrys sp.]|jgi:serine/threonine protein phosphatase 1